jgi:hypothetical protein
VVCPDGNFIVTIYGGEHLSKVTLCLLETFSWLHSMGDRWRKYDDLVLFDGRLHALTAGEYLLAFDGVTPHPSAPRPSTTASAPGTLAPTPPPLCQDPVRPWGAPP